MPMSFYILNDQNCVYVRCQGMITVSETMEAFQDYASRPDFRPGQSQLIDLSDVTDYERDFTKIMSLQAQQADVYLSSDTPIYLIFIAPNSLTQSMAMSSLRSWRNLPGVVPMVLSDLDEAVEVLSANGLSPTKLRALV